MTRFVPSAGPVSFGNAYSDPLEVHIWAVSELVQLPDAPSMSIRLKQSAYPTATTFHVSPTVLTTDTTALGVHFGGGCDQVYLEDPLDVTLVSISGTPCSNGLNVQASTAY